MKNKHEKAGQTIIINDGEFKGKEYVVEDWWENVAGKSWMDSHGNPACMEYAIRSTLEGVPTDNNVLYGKIDGFGKLIHVSQI